MSLTQVKPYFRTIMNELGHSEWTDGFNWLNIPNTVIDRTYHLELTESSAIKQNMNDIEIEQPLVVRLFLKGFRDPALAVDDAMSYAEAIIKEVLKPSRRLTGDLKNVKLTSTNPEPFGESNDNIVMMRMEFLTLVILAPN